MAAIIGTLVLILVLTGLLVTIVLRDNITQCVINIAIQSCALILSIWRIGLEIQEGESIFTILSTTILVIVILLVLIFKIIELVMHSH